MATDGITIPTPPWRGTVPPPWPSSFWWLPFCFQEGKLRQSGFQHLLPHPKGGMEPRGRRKGGRFQYTPRTHQQRLRRNPAGQGTRHSHLHRALGQRLGKQVHLGRGEHPGVSLEQGGKIPNPRTASPVPLAYIGHSAAAEPGVDVDVGFGDLLAEAAGGQEALEERGFLVTRIAAPGKDHGPCLHHAGQVGHDPQHFGPGREELGKDGDGRRGASHGKKPKVTGDTGGCHPSGWRRREEHGEGAGGTAGRGQGYRGVSCMGLGENGGERRGGGGKEEEENER